MTPKKKSTLTTNTSPDGRGIRTAEIPNLAIAPLGAPLRPSELQMKTWDAAVQLFSRRRYEEAAELFRETAKGPAVHVADKARSYGQICERKLAKPDLEFRTAEDHFYCGVERLNARDLDQARHHLSRALRMQPDGDHILYTLALCCGFAGDANGAYENLKGAIDLDARNRVVARQDSEFRALAVRFPALLALLGTDAAGES